MGCENVYVISPVDAGSDPFAFGVTKKIYINNYEIIVTAGDAARGEGLLYLPLVKTRIPVEWQGLTVNKSKNGEYGCVLPEGQVQMQGSQTGAISNDLYRQVMALLTQGPGSFSGKFIDGLDELQQLAANLAEGKPIDAKKATGVIAAVQKGIDSYKASMAKYFDPDQSGTLPPEIQAIIDELEVLKASLDAPLLTLTACANAPANATDGGKNEFLTLINFDAICDVPAEQRQALGEIKGGVESSRNEIEVTTGELQIEKMVLPLTFTVTGNNSNIVSANQELIVDADRRVNSEDSQSHTNKPPSTQLGRDYFKEIVSVWNLKGTNAYRQYFQNLFTTPVGVVLQMRAIENRSMVYPQLLNELSNLDEDFLKSFFMDKIRGYFTDADGIHSTYSGDNKSKYEQNAADLLNHFYGKTGSDYFNTKVIADAIYDTEVGKRRIDNMIKIMDRLFFLKIGETPKKFDSNPNFYKNKFTRSALGLDWVSRPKTPNFFPSFGATDAISFNATNGNGDNEKLGLYCIGGTQGIKVTVKNVSPILNVSERGYEATIIIQYLDTFGVSEGDFNKSITGGGVNFINFNYRGGVLSQWILQHQYNYPPFTDYLTYEIKMKRTWETK